MRRPTTTRSAHSSATSINILLLPIKLLERLGNLNAPPEDGDSHRSGVETKKPPLKQTEIYQPAGYQSFSIPSLPTFTRQVCVYESGTRDRVPFCWKTRILVCALAMLEVFNAHWAWSLTLI